MSADVVRVEPTETAGPPMELRSIEAVAANSRAWPAENQVHGVEVEGNFVGEGRFAVRFAIDTTFRPTGERTTITNVSPYTTEDGKVVRIRCQGGAREAKNRFLCSGEADSQTSSSAC